MTIREQLDANIPRDAISTRSQSGKNLSYLEGWYVIDRLNQVLGTENWSWRVEQIIPVTTSDKLAYIVRGTLEVRFDRGEKEGSYREWTSKDGMGYGADKGSYNPGEMAIKEAETDAFKRAAMKLGRSLGLALYDKTQEFVDDDVAEKSAKAPETAPSTDRSGEAKRVNRSTTNRAGTVDSKVLKGQIKNAFAVLQAQKKITKEDFVKDYTAGVKVDDLAESAVLQVLSKLKQNFPDLGL